MISDEDLMSIINNPYEHSTRSVRMAREIVAYRKAFNNPVAWEVKGVYCGSYSEAKSMFPQRMPCPLFEKPIIPDQEI